VTAVLTRASVPAPADGWEQQAACRATVGGLDLTELTESARKEAARNDGAYTYETRAGVVTRDYAADLAVAQQLCAACPVVAQCRAAALAVTDVAGFAGGLTEAQRTDWRKRNKVKVRPGTARDLLPPDVAVRDDGQTLARVTEPILLAVRHMVAMDHTSEAIATSLGVPVTTVRHSRQILAGSRARKRAS
jgi:hypothetical protein